MTDAVTTDRVDAGDHACLTFTDTEERLDLVARFVRDGLRSGLKVVCWTDSGSPEVLVSELSARAVRPGAALRRGQLRIVPVSGSMLDRTGADGTGSAGTGADGAVSASAMVDMLASEVDAAGREGYPGLRVTADMGWATRPAAASEELVAFESEVAGLFQDGRLCLICQYDRERFDAVTLAFAARAHPKTVAARVYHEHALLRICRQYSPPGLRIAGQMDYRHKDVLEQALAESMRLDRNNLHVNLVGLEYIDGACAGVIVATAMRLPPSRRMTVTCRRAIATVVDLVGGSTAPRLRVQQHYEQR